MEPSIQTLERLAPATMNNSAQPVAFGVGVMAVLIYFAFFANSAPDPAKVEHDNRLREMQRQTDLLNAEVRRRTGASQPRLSSRSYSELEVGRSGYTDACAILNGPGREVNKSGSFTTYQWQRDGKTIVATFNDRDVLISRSQVGVH